MNILFLSKEFSYAWLTKQYKIIPTTETNLQTFLFRLFFYLVDIDSLTYTPVIF